MEMTVKYNNHYYSLERVHLVFEELTSCHSIWIGM